MEACNEHCGRIFSQSDSQEILEFVELINEDQSNISEAVKCLPFLFKDSNVAVKIETDDDKLYEKLSQLIHSINGNKSKFGTMLALLSDVKAYVVTNDEKPVKVGSYISNISCLSHSGRSRTTLRFEFENVKMDITTNYKSVLTYIKIVTGSLADILYDKICLHKMHDIKVHKLCNELIGCVLGN